MAAFEKVLSGIPMMDTALDYIRLGDNVVWQVAGLDEFRLFATSFARQAIRDGRNLIYVRFAEHEPILQPMEGLRIIPVELSPRFETFSIDIHNLIEKEGTDAFYVFDCLSELEEAWATDLMMGNFFHLTCPYLFTLDTVAYFPLIRGRHSFEAIAQIWDTTQLFLDVFPGDGDGLEELFVRPVKVWNRHAPAMFSPHSYYPRTGQFRPLETETEISRFSRQTDRAARENQNQNIDSWERFFQRTKQKVLHGQDVTEECGRLCDVMLTRDDRLRELIKQHFRPQDYFHIHERMVGTGMIGGKACGMLLARKLIANVRPDIYERIQPHDSFFVGSDVFYAYIVDNGFWDLKIRQKSDEGYFALAESFSQQIMQGRFSPNIRAAFRKVMDYYGDAPIIVRSSSILEDGFGNAFAGKYESVFCGGQGTLEERLEAFEQAVRTVYASTVSMSALDYRKRRGLEKLDEQMGILVQRVSGARHGDFFMPCAAGVGYSISPYRMGVEHPEEGMLRLVAGLGTAAVDRRTGSYPRIVSLDNPAKVPHTSSADRHKYSQRLIDVVVDRPEPQRSQNAEQVRKVLPEFQTDLLFSHDWDGERAMRERGTPRSIYYVSCDGLVENTTLMDDMREILRLLQETYNYPVDIEYAINATPDGQYSIDLLQCRPLQQTGERETVSLPDVPDKERILLETKGVSMGFSRKFPVDVIVYIDAIAYYQMPYREKYKVKDALSAINWYFRGQDKRLLLITPGRICTSSPELGVPSAFVDISEFDAIFEVSERKAGYVPELSYGSHIFQDLVEAEILYTAIFEEDSTRCFQPDKLRGMTNSLEKYVDSSLGLEDVVFVCETADKGFELYYDMSSERLLIIDDRENKPVQ